MTDPDLCQSLLYAIAGTPTAVPWAAVAIHPAGCLLLWDDREDATSLILEGVASESGDMLTTTSIERGPNRRPVIGVLVRPREGDAAASNFWARYALATTSSEVRLSRYEIAKRLEIAESALSRPYNGQRGVAAARGRGCRRAGGGEGGAKIVTTGVNRIMAAGECSE